jgi:hypothetical protein
MTGRSMTLPTYSYNLPKLRRGRKGVVPRLEAWVVACKSLLFPCRSGALFCALDRESEGYYPRDELSVDRGSSDAVIFTDPVVLAHEEGVFRQRDCVGFRQPRDEVGVNHGSRLCAVFANRTVVKIRHVECVALHRERGGEEERPRD